MTNTSQGAAYDIASYCATTLGKGTLATDVFVDTMPSTPDNLISVYEYGGAPSSMPMGNTPASAIEHPSIQVAVRNTNPATARATAYSVYKSLDGLGGVEIQGITYQHMRALHPPFLLEVDQNKRTVFAFSLWIDKARG